MCQDSTYNGWSNYETWCVNLWLENEQSTYEMLREMAREVVTAASRYGPFHPANSPLTDASALPGVLAEQIKDYVEEQNPLGSDASLYSDLLNSAISECDFHEIATGILEDLAEVS